MLGPGLIRGFTTAMVGGDNERSLATHDRIRLNGFPDREYEIVGAVGGG